MADYTEISNVSVEPLAPVTSELMTALRDNPIAISEGALGSPRILSPSLRPTFITVGETVTTDLRFGGMAGTISGRATNLLSTTNTLTIRYRTSTNGGTSYGAWENLSSFDIDQEGSLIYAVAVLEWFPTLTNAVQIQFEDTTGLSISDTKSSVYLFGDQT